MQHRHLGGQAVVGLALHDAARAVEHFVGDGDIAPHRQAVHELAVGLRPGEPILAHGPIFESGTERGVTYGVAVVPRRAPFFGVEDLRPGERFGAIVGLAHRAARGGRGRAGLVHDLGRQREPVRTQHHHLHAAVRRHVQRRSRDGERRDARVVGPGQHELGALRHGELVHRLPVGERLAGMVHRRLEVDERFVDHGGHRLETRLGDIFGEVLAFGEGADAERIGVGGKHGQALADVLGAAAVHHRAEPCFELPGPLSRGDHERTAAEPLHADLEGGERAQRGIEEHETQDLARQCTRFRMRLEAACEREEVQHLVSAEVGQVEEVLHNPSSAARSRSTSASRSV